MHNGLLGRAQLALLAGHACRAERVLSASFFDLSLSVERFGKDLCGRPLPIASIAPGLIFVLKISVNAGTQVPVRDRLYAINPLLGMWRLPGRDARVPPQFFQASDLVDITRDRFLQYLTSQLGRSACL